MIKYTKYLYLPKDTIDYYDKLLHHNGKYLYDKYGLKRDETITHTVKFDDGCEIDIKIVICEDDELPYIDAVLFDRYGSELCCTTAYDDTYAGEYELEDDGNAVYTVIIAWYKQ